MIEALLDENNRVDPNKQAQQLIHRTQKGDGLTALELAFSYLHLEAAQLLIERGRHLG